MKRCYSCFLPFSDEFMVCPHCGAVVNDHPKEPIYLYPGSVLENRYIIGEAVGQGGFGIIYKAWDNKLDTIVALKEFYVSKLVTRAEGIPDLIVSRKAQEEFIYRKKRFLAEARTMAKFGTHKNIPNVFEFFEANNTAYIVMELLEGIALNDYLTQVGGKLDADFAIMIAEEVGNALISMHQEKIIHRDVAPDNIYICSGKEIKIKLLDLGAAKLSDETDEFIDIILKPGYSPVEQYDNTKNVGPWSDIYALGATLYSMVTGVKPDESTNRKQEDTVVPPNELNANVSQELSNAIMRAMALERHLRFKSVEEFIKAIHGEIKVRTVEEEKKKRKNLRLSSIVAAAVVVAIFAGIFGGIWGDKTEKLSKAEITVWFDVREGSTEEEAMKAVIDDFGDKFPNVTINCKAFPEAEYEQALAEAVASNNLPTLFESTFLPVELLNNAKELDNVLISEQFKDCLFLDQFNNYYSNTKKVPLGIIVPVVEIITNGPVKVEYTDSYFSNPSDFHSDASFAENQNCHSLIVHNFGEGEYRAKDSFLQAKSPVYFTSTMEIYDSEIREQLQEYPKSFVYPDKDEIYCSFTYEWSIGQGNEPQIAAAEKLLSWMLGNVYQSYLMISKAHDGQIPLDNTCFLSKIENDSKLKPILEIYEKFIFSSDV